MQRNYKEWCMHGIFIDDDEVHELWYRENPPYKLLKKSEPCNERGPDAPSSPSPTKDDAAKDSKEAKYSKESLPLRKTKNIIIIIT